MKKTSYFCILFFCFLTNISAQILKQDKINNNTINTIYINNFIVYYATNEGLIKVQNNNTEILFKNSDITNIKKIDNKLYYSDIEGNIINLQNNDTIFSNNSLSAINDFIIDNNFIIISTISGGLIYYDYKNFTRIENINPLTLYKKSEKIFVGTPKGIYYFDAEKKEIFNLSENCKDKITSIKENKNNLWFVGNNFLWKLENAKLDKIKYPENFNLPQAITFENNNIWIGGGYCENQIIIYNILKKKFINSLNIDCEQVQSMEYSEKENIILIGTWGCGLYKYKILNEKELSNEKEKLYLKINNFNLETDSTDEVKDIKTYKNDTALISFLEKKICKELDTLIQNNKKCSKDSLKIIVKKLEKIYKITNSQIIKEKKTDLEYLTGNLHKVANIVFCSDVSGSMRSGLTILSNGIIDFLKNSNNENNDIISFILCDQTGNTAFKGLTYRQKDSIKKEMRRLPPQISYSFPKGIQNAIKTSKNYHSKNSVNRIIFCVDHQFIEDYSGNNKTKRTEAEQVIKKIDSINNSSDLRISLWYFENSKNEMNELKEKFGAENSILITEKNINEKLNKLLNFNTVIIKDINIKENYNKKIIKFKTSFFNKNSLFFFSANHVDTTLNIFNKNKFQWIYEIDISKCNYDKNQINNYLKSNKIKYITSKFKNEKIIIKTKRGKFIRSKYGINKKSELYIEFIEDNSLQK